MTAAVAAMGPQLPRGEHAAGTGIRRAIADGLRFVRRNQALKGSFAIDLVAMTFGMPRALFAVLSVSVYGTGAAGTGVLYAAVSAGAVVAALTTGWLGRARRLGRIVVAAVVVWGTRDRRRRPRRARCGRRRPCSRSRARADSISAVCRSTINQTVTPDALRGRMSSVFTVVVTGGPRLGRRRGGRRGLAHERALLRRLRRARLRRRRGAGGRSPSRRCGPTSRPGASMSRSSSPAGSSVSPVWTGEHCRTVLDGATSQWKRSDGSSAAIGPGRRRRRPRSARTRPGDRATAARSMLGSRASTRRSSSAVRAARKPRGRQNSTTPALTHSPRSTRGTTRTIAYWNGLRAGTARLLGLGGEAARRREPAAAGTPCRRRAPAARTTPRARGRRSPPPSPSSSRGASRASASAMLPGERQQDVVAHRRERPLGLGRRVLPGVLAVERGAVVDQPQAPVPAQQVGVLRRAVDVRARARPARRCRRPARRPGADPRPACTSARRAGSRARR